MDLKWEFLIRQIFGIVLNDGIMIGRNGDPSGFADNDLFVNRRILEVKALTSYAFLCLNTKIINNNEIELDSNFMINDILEAKDIKDIDETIKKYQEQIFNKFFEANNETGKFSLKNQ